MKIVIDIPEEVYNRFCSCCRFPDEVEEAIIAITDGTPLPKGHGKIVDISKLIDSKCNECGHIRGVTCTIPCYEVRRMLSDAPTIVEADNTESEEANDES